MAGIAFVNLIWISNVHADLEKKTIKAIKGVTKKLLPCKEASAKLITVANSWDNYLKANIEGNQEMVLEQKTMTDRELYERASFPARSKNWRKAKNQMKKAISNYQKKCQKITGAFNNVHKGLKK